MTSYKSNSNSRDVSPSYKENKIIMNYNGNQTTTTKIKPKNDANKIQGSTNSSINNYFNYTKKIGPVTSSANRNNLSKSKDKDRSTELTKNSTKNKSLNKISDLDSNSFNQSKDNDKIKSVSPIKNAVLNYGNNSNNNSKTSIGSNNITTTKISKKPESKVSIINKKFDQIKQESSNINHRKISTSPDRVTVKDKSGIGSLDNTRNTSKEVLKESITPKSSTSDTKKSPNKFTNYSTNNSSTTHKSSKSPQLRNNKFSNQSTIQGKKNFRDLNTSPLLINKNVNSLKSGVSSGVSTTTIPKKIQKGSLLNQLNNVKLVDGTQEATTFQQNNTVNKENFNKEILSNNKLIYQSKSISKVYEISRIGYSGPNVKKYNQDNYFIFENFLNNPDSIYLAVCDGHGVNGHDASKYLRENLPNELNKEWLKQQELKRGFLKPEEYNKVIVDIFHKVNYNVFNLLDSDTSFSGSTCVSLIYNIDSLICANVGDSRCTIGRKFNNGTILI